MYQDCAREAWGVGIGYGSNRISALKEFVVYREKKLSFKVELDKCLKECGRDS